MAAIDNATFGRAVRLPARPDTPTQVATRRLPLLAILYLFCVLIPIGFQIGPLAMTTLRLLLLVMVIPLSVGLVTGRYGKPIATDALMFAHLLWATVALAINNPSFVVQQAGSIGIEFIGGYLVGRAAIRTREDFKALCLFLILSIIFLVLPLAIFENFTFRALLLEIIRNIPGLDAPIKVRPDPRMGFFRAQSVFAHSIHSGIYCSIAVSLCFVALKGTIKNKTRWISVFLIVLAASTSLSSGAILAVTLQSGLIVWHMTFARVKTRWWILVGLSVFSYGLVDILSNRTPVEVFMSYATFSAHNAYWRSLIFDWGLDNVIGSAARGIPASLWFGIGLHNWVRPPWMGSSSVDNFWLLMAMRYGLPGFFLLAAGYVLLIAQVMRRNFDTDVVLRRFRRGWVFAFLGLTFALCTVHVWTNIYSFVFFMLGAGAWLIDAKPEQEEQTRTAAADTRPKEPVYSRFGLKAQSES